MLVLFVIEVIVDVSLCALGAPPAVGPVIALLATIAMRMIANHRRRRSVPEKAGAPKRPRDV